jgi:hypothetical protein
MIDGTREGRTLTPHILNDEEYVRWIGTVSFGELVMQIIENPSYLTDPYYTAFGNALRKRAFELTEGNY